MVIFIIVDIKTKQGNRDSHKAKEHTAKNHVFPPNPTIPSPLYTHMYVHT